jgi:hypothetical protein
VAGTLGDGSDRSVGVTVADVLGEGAADSKGRGDGDIIATATNVGVIDATGGAGVAADKPPPKMPKVPKKQTRATTPTAAIRPTGRRR